MASDVLKEFMIAIGFKVDDQSQRRFDEAVGRSEKAAAAFGAAVVATAAAVTAATVKIAAQFEALYYVSQRVGATAQNVQALKFAFSQVGSTGNDAAAAVESFSRSLRTNPGMGSLIRELGVATAAGGKARDSVEVLLDTIDKLKAKFPYYVGKQYAETLGISEDQFNTLVKYRDEIKRYREEYARTARIVGLNSEEAARRAAEFERTLGSLKNTFGAIVDKIFTDLVPAFKAVADYILNWIKANPEKLTAVMNEISAAIERWTLSLIRWMDNADKEGGAISVMKRMADQIDRLIVGAKKIKELWDLLDTPITDRFGWTGATVPAGKDVGPGGGWSITKAPGLVMRGIGAVGTMIRNGIVGPAEAKEGGGGFNPGAKGSARTGDMMRWAMDQLRREGVPEGNVRAAAAHLVGQAQMESGLDPNKSHDGGTGFGIYGARDPTPGKGRRTDMFSWLDANGYPRNSAEGQMRYMAIEAMSGKYPTTRNILISANPGSFGGDTPRVTGEFERPLVINYRTGAVSGAYNTGPSEPGAAKPGTSAPTGTPLAKNIIIFGDQVGQSMREAARGTVNGAALGGLTSKQVLDNILGAPRDELKGKHVIGTRPAGAALSGRCDPLRS